MASQVDIFTILARATEPLGREEISDLVGQSYRYFQTQLDRWVKGQLIQDTGDHHYVLTDKGREIFSNLILPKVGKSQVGQFHLIVTQDDLNKVPDAHFKSVWDALGRVIRARISTVE